MDNFLTWEALLNYTTFIGVVLMIVEFTKGVWKIKKIPTQAWSVIVATILLAIVNGKFGTFKLLDIALYFINAIAISLGSNGLYDKIANKKDKAEDK